MATHEPTGAAGSHVIVVGGETLALRVCEELRAAGGLAVTVLWTPDPDFAERVEGTGAQFVGRNPNDEESLRRAGVEGARAILILTDDDFLTLHVALKARDLNPSIRIVLRQFNRTLGRKIEQNLENCSVVSISAHAAATYASVALDRDCYYGFQFPDIDGPLVGFFHRSIEREGLGGMALAEAERRLHERILGLTGSGAPAPPELPQRGEVISFGKIECRPSEAVRDAARRPFDARRLGLRRALRRTVARLDPVAKGAFAVAVVTLAAATAYFSFALGLGPLEALYFVVATATTTGFGDITPRAGGPHSILVTIVLMLAGLTFTGIYIAVLSSRFTEAQWVSVQGLRHVRRAGHFIVCGSGNVGSRVIEYLLRLRLPLIVIEKAPKPEVVERSRDGRFVLLTGDATVETTLDLCSLDRAYGLVALTSSDTGNLEVALAARARNPDLPIVMRCQESEFATAIARHFGIDKTFGTADLMAPAIADLARFFGAHGRVTLDGRPMTIGEFSPRARAADPRWIPLAAWQWNELRTIDSFEFAKGAERVLFCAPLSAMNG